MADSDNLISCSQQTCKKNGLDMVDKWKKHFEDSSFNK